MRTKLIDVIRGFDYNYLVNNYFVLFIYRGKHMEYLSIKQTSEKWGISTRRIQILCGEERIPGAIKIGSYWAIPANADKPNDNRVKTGKYIKSEKN